jgi:hypothetical protein
MVEEEAGPVEAIAPTITAMAARVTARRNDRPKYHLIARRLHPARVRGRPGQSARRRRGGRALQAARFFRALLALATWRRRTLNNSSAAGGARSSAGEHYLDTVGVTGSIPVAPTIKSTS